MKQSRKAIQEKRNPLYKKLVKWMWGLSILAILSGFALFIFLSNSNLPTFEDLENPASSLATDVYANNGEVLGRYFIENRVPVTYNNLSPHIIKALIATEDERYHRHSGIDGPGLARALFFMGKRGGASTITQQLAKLLYTEHRAKNIRQRLVQKLKEWVTSVRLERSYTKEEIMAMYLNKFDFINDSYGIQAASETYFGKSQDSLQLEEAAVLVGMLKNPDLYSPIKRPDMVRHRRNVVMMQMVKNDFLSKAKYDELKERPLNMTNFERTDHTKGIATYFRMEIKKDIAQILKNKAIKKPDGSNYDIHKDGLKIYTTIDPTIQRYAEESVIKKMAELQKRYWKVWKNDDPWTYIDPEKIKRAEEEDEEELDTELLLSIRRKELQKLIHESPRYRNLKNRYLAKAIANLQGGFDDYSIRDYDLTRMIQSVDDPEYFDLLIENKLATKKKIATYKRIMRSDQWPHFYQQALKLQAIAKKEFDTKVKMRVFDYNTVFEKDTIMSPLDSVRYHRMILQTGVLAVEPGTGYIKAWVGGVNYKYFKYDHIRIDRQVGSTFKPFVYSTAILMQGVSPCFKVIDAPQTISIGESNFGLNKDWTPRNADNKYTGEALTLKDGLRKSKNTISVYLMKQLGSAVPVVDLVNNMGIHKKAKRSNGRYRVPRSPAICLGAVDLSVWEMTGAYTTFANNGVYSKPVAITKIEDKNGKVLYQYMPYEKTALPKNINYVIREMLRYNMVGAGGFGNIKSQLGGKTGTTNSYVDGWFIGVTPNLVVGTWVGGEDQWIHFKTLGNGAGSRMARPIFLELLTKLEQDESVYDVSARFQDPTGNIGIELDCSKYQYGDEGDDFFDEIENNDDNPPTENDDFNDDPFSDEDGL